jgi:hypothetical protein
MPTSCTSIPLMANSRMPCIAGVLIGSARPDLIGRQLLRHPTQLRMPAGARLTVAPQRRLRADVTDLGEKCCPTSQLNNVRWDVMPLAGFDGYHGASAANRTRDQRPPGCARRCRRDQRSADAAHVLPPNSSSRAIGGPTQFQGVGARPDRRYRAPTVQGNVHPVGGGSRAVGDWRNGVGGHDPMGDRLRYRL